VASLLIATAQTSPADATSNLAAWYELLPALSAPAWLANPSTDEWAVWIGVSSLFIGAALFISSLRRSPTRPIIEPRAAPHEWNSASQSKLVEYLREYSGHDENVEVQFVAMQHKPLADTLASVFSLAGWDAQVSPPVSLESFLNEYFVGILVGGQSTFGGICC
jgi:hypothetical protein